MNRNSLHQIHSVLGFKIEVIFAFLLLLILALSIFGATGCKTQLDPAGVYKGDTFLYNVDNTIVTGHQILQDFVNWEATYRTTLAQWPEIKQFADNVVNNGAQWFQSADALRSAYKADPSAANKTALQTATDIINAALAQTANYLSAHKAVAPQKLAPTVKTNAWLLPPIDIRVVPVG